MPSILVSDDDMANDSVREFRKSKREWLVSVRQVSEGTDIQRLQVLCYLTNYATEMFFRQVIGRVSRRRFHDDSHVSEKTQQADEGCYVYIPSDPRLIAFAEQIEKIQLGALKSPPEPEGSRGKRDGTEKQSPIFLGSSHEGQDWTVVPGQSFPSQEAEVIKRIINYGVSAEVAVRIFCSEIRGQPLPSPGPSPVPQEETEEDRIHESRKKCHTLAKRLAHLRCLKRGLKRDEKPNWREETSKIHGAWKPHETMSLAELKAKEKELEEIIARE
jgi:hypothetical protein